MICCARWLSTAELTALVLAGWLGPLVAWGQIDPEKRELFQFGYNAALEGHPPLSIYAFYYRNQPDFIQSNLTLRLAVAPTYLDSELGIKSALGENTDLGIGLAGGGYADSYYEIRRDDHGPSRYIPQESFDGYGSEVNLSLYHLFNPGRQIPLYGMLRGMAHYAWYDRTGDTAPDFKIAPNHGIFTVRTGLRFGGKEPTLFPDLAMELSAWYEGIFRTHTGEYGFNDDRSIESQSHLFWGEALLAYTLPSSNHHFYVSMTGGTSIEADRFSAYRLGGLLPLVAEYPLSLPGYFYQELSAQRFALFGGNYIVALDHRKRWNINATASTALVDYLPGLSQPGHWRSGVGGGVFYSSPSWRVMVGYAYGVGAIRDDGTGAHSIGILLQLDLAHAKEAFFDPESGSHWRGLQRFMGVFGS